MAETRDTTAETLESRTRGDVAATQSQTSPRIYRIAAGVGIAVGCVIITGAVFLFGLLIGSQSGSWSDGGYEAGSWSDEGMGWYDVGDDPAWDMGPFPGDPSSTGGQPGPPTNSPPAPGR